MAYALQRKRDRNLRNLPVFPGESMSHEPWSDPSPYIAPSQLPQLARSQNENLMQVLAQMQADAEEARERDRASIERDKASRRREVLMLWIAMATLIAAIAALIH